MVCYVINNIESFVCKDDSSSSSSVTVKVQGFFCLYILLHTALARNHDGMETLSSGWS